VLVIKKYTGLAEQKKNRKIYVDVEKVLLN